MKLNGAETLHCALSPVRRETKARTDEDLLLYCLEVALIGRDVPRTPFMRIATNRVAVLSQRVPRAAILVSCL
jgi:hypothetical protein